MRVGAWGVTMALSGLLLAAVVGCNGRDRYVERRTVVRHVSHDPAVRRGVVERRAYPYGSQRVYRQQRTSRVYTQQPRRGLDRRDSDYRRRDYRRDADRRDGRSRDSDRWDGRRDRDGRDGRRGGDRWDGRRGSYRWDGQRGSDRWSTVELERLFSRPFGAERA